MATLSFSVFLDKLLDKSKQQTIREYKPYFKCSCGWKGARSRLRDERRGVVDYLEICPRCDMNVYETTRLEVGDHVDIKAEGKFLYKARIFKAEVKGNKVHYEFERIGHRNQKDSANNNWKGGSQSYWNKHAREDFFKGNVLCELCGSTEKIVIHHKNKDITDNSQDNLQALCGACHNKIHHEGKLNPNWKGGEVILKCEVCNKEYSVRPYRAKKSKYCSLKCTGEAKRRKK